MKERVSKDVLRKNRLPPGQYEVPELPVLDLGKQPDIKQAEWELEITGAVKKRGYHDHGDPWTEERRRE